MTKQERKVVEENLHASQAQVRQCQWIRRAAAILVVIALIALMFQIPGAVWLVFLALVALYLAVGTFWEGFDDKAACDYYLDALQANRVEEGKFHATAGIALKLWEKGAHLLLLRITEEEILPVSGGYAPQPRETNTIVRLPAPPPIESIYRVLSREETGERLDLTIADHDLEWDVELYDPIQVGWSALQSELGQNASSFGVADS